MKVFVTGPGGPVEELAPLREAGHELILGRPMDQPARVPYTEEELIQLSRDADVILASLDPITRRVMELAERLRLVVVPFIGTDKIDIAAATELGILVANSPTAQNFIGVAEATIGLILMLLKRVKHNEAKLRRGQWSQREDRGSLLWGKTVGLVGLGRVGAHVASRLGPWEVRLLAHDPYAPAEQARALNVTLVDLPTLLTESDIVSLHAVLTSETRRMIGKLELKSMKPTAVFVNTARGELVDEEALAQALEEHWIAGAALDTFELEPLPKESRLRDLNPEQLILTPHNVSHSEAGRQANLQLAIETILKACHGELPEHVVNPEAVPRWRSRLQAMNPGGNTP